MPAPGVARTPPGTKTDEHHAQDLSARAPSITAPAELLNAPFIRRRKKGRRTRFTPARPCEKVFLLLFFKKEASC